MRGLKYRFAFVIISYFCSRIPNGMRGLKSELDDALGGGLYGRIPNGMRGLKFFCLSMSL